ncbi:MAG: nucleoside hydrolase [Ruminococcaceae bacterium]|nr:nucleoside hydrolase [Oscillospiraceae bacterium]
MEKRKIIIDVDTGHDDAIAIMMAMLCKDEFDILGIATVNGNVCLDYTTENTLRVVEFMGGGVPVYRGCEYPLVACMYGKRPTLPKKDKPGEKTHGWLLDELPKATIAPESQDAVTWYVDTLMAAEDESITLVPVGPLTNLAHVFQIEPRTVKKIKEVICMGGGYKYGNTNPLSEYNIWVDPEAAEIVMRAGIKKFTWVPLDACYASYMTKDDVQRIRDIGNRVADAAADIISFIWSHPKFIGKDVNSIVFDALCISYMLDSSVLKTIVPAHCTVDNGGGIADGQTMFDIFNGRIGGEAPNCYVALDSDREKFLDIVCEVMSKAKEAGV